MIIDKCVDEVLKNWPSLDSLYTYIYMFVLHHTNRLNNNMLNQTYEYLECFAVSYNPIQTETSPFQIVG